MVIGFWYLRRKREAYRFHTQVRGSRSFFSFFFPKLKGVHLEFDIWLGASGIRSFLELEECEMNRWLCTLSIMMAMVMMSMPVGHVRWCFLAHWGDDGGDGDDTHALHLSRTGMCVGCLIRRETFLESELAGVCCNGRRWGRNREGSLCGELVFLAAPSAIFSPSLLQQAYRQST